MTLGLSLALDAYAENKMAELDKELTLAFDTSLYYQARADLEAVRYQDAWTRFNQLEAYSSISKDFNLHWRYWFDYARTCLLLGEQEQAIEKLKKAIEVIEYQSTDFRTKRDKISFLKTKQKLI